MSDLENSDDEIDLKKDEKDEDEDISDKPKIISKKIITGYTDDTDDEDDELAEDEDDEEDIIGLQDDEIQVKDILSKEKISTTKLDNQSYDLENDNLSPIKSDVESDYDDELQKFESDLTSNYVKKHHPECLYLNNN